MPRFKLTLEYDGAPFVGWQRQENGVSVQEALEDAIFAMTGERAVAHGAGRTDAGVHATGQVAHVDLARDWPPFRLSEGLNAHLRPTPVAVLSAEMSRKISTPGIARTARHYVYRVINRRAPLTFDRGQAWQVKQRLDVEAMADAARMLLGRHDFSTFRDSQCQAASPIRTLDRLDVGREGDMIRFEVGAFIPASAGPLDGRVAGRCRRGTLDRCGPQGRVRSRRSRALRPGRGLAARALSGQGAMLIRAASPGTPAKYRSITRS